MDRPKSSGKCERMAACVCDRDQSAALRVRAAWCRAADDMVWQAKVLGDHADRKWSNSEIDDAFDKHGLMTWGATDAAKKTAIRVRSWHIRDRPLMARRLCAATARTSLTTTTSATWTSTAWCGAVAAAVRDGRRPCARRWGTRWTRPSSRRWPSRCAALRTRTRATSSPRSAPSLARSAARTVATG